MNPGDARSRSIDKATPSPQYSHERAYPGSRLLRGPDAGGGTCCVGLFCVLKAVLSFLHARILPVTLLHHNLSQPFSSLAEEQSLRQALLLPATPEIEVLATSDLVALCEAIYYNNWGLATRSCYNPWLA
jgi:hypothetical protein